MAQRLAEFRNAIDVVAAEDIHPWDILLFIFAAVIIVWLNRRKMFQRGSGITDVLMPDGSDDLST